RFGGDPAIIGQNISFDDQNYTVIGVMPSKYDFPMTTEVWTPYAMPAARRNSRGVHTVMAVGRLKSGSTIERANGGVERIGARLSQIYPASNTNRHFAVWPAMRFLVDKETRQYLQMMLGSVLFVLL